MSNETRKQYDEDFKRHIVELYDAGQTRAELAKAYNLHPTSVSNWIKYYKTSGSFKAARENVSVKSCSCLTSSSSKSDASLLSTHSSIIKAFMGIKSLLKHSEKRSFYRKRKAFKDNEG